MEISTALHLIKKKLKGSIMESKHFKEKCIERSLDIVIIRKTISKSKILGIVEQNDHLYKIWFSYEKHKDLNIIMSINNLRKLKFITIFPSDSDRRRRS